MTAHFPHLVRKPGRAGWQSFFDQRRPASTRNGDPVTRPVTWNVAHLTFADGSTAVFQPRAFDLTFTFEGQSMTQVASKNGPGFHGVQYFRQPRRLLPVGHRHR
jgi:hypothetical protein